MNAQTDPAAAAEAALFAHCLSFEAHLPADFIAGDGPGRLTQAQSLLRALALVEDMGIDDAPGEHDDTPTSSQRMEAKLDLSLLLLGRVLEQTRPTLPMRRVRWSLRGVRLHEANTPPLPIGAGGVLHIQPCDWLPEPLELPAQVLATNAERQLWLRFPEFPFALRDALERHLFRQHRRQIAQARLLSITP